MPPRAAAAAPTAGGDKLPTELPHRETRHAEIRAGMAAQRQRRARQAPSRRRPGAGAAHRSLPPARPPRTPQGNFTDTPTPAA